MSDKEKKLDELIKDLKSDPSELTKKPKSKLPSKASFLKLAKEVKEIFDREERELQLSTH